VKLAGARVVVTGASRGIGAALATECAQRGAKVVLVARSREPLEKLAAELDGEVFVADLTDADAIESLVRSIEAAGSIDVLVNNAGVDSTGMLVDVPVCDIQRLVELNLVAPMLMSRAAIPAMVARGRGHILNMGSLAGSAVLPGLTAYSSSKAGLGQFTSGLRAELRGTGVTTTLAELGLIPGEMVDSVRSVRQTERAVKRLEHLQLLRDLDLDAVVGALADAIEHERRHVRMPKRAVLFPLFVEAPRRLMELLLTGVK
jgi:short-subunit dehydrogenase